MHRSVYTRIANQHSQTKPGWIVPDGAPSAWIEQAIKPLLADLMTPPPRVELHHDQQARQPVHGASSTDQTARFIGWIHLTAAVAKSDYYSPHRYYSNGGHSLRLPLYWISRTGADHQVAITPQWIGDHIYYHAASPKLSDLRYLAGPEALRALLEALLEQLRQQAFKEQKANKVRNLQTQAVQAQLRQIANEERFAFNITTTARLIRIGVRLDGNHQLTISAPFSEFEKVLPQLRDTVINLRALHQRRIHFRTHQCLYRSGPWIEPDPLPDAGPASS